MDPTPVRGLRRLAERTPARRERHVDLLRAVAIAAVVLGHWLLFTVEDANGPGGTSALRDVRWAHLLTWLFQVMPVFFLVGGFANAASLQAHRRDGGADGDWLLTRSARLLHPTAVLLLALAAGALAVRAAGADPALVGTAVWAASLPLWFLVVYLGVVFLTPVMHALHRRAGLWVPVLLVVPVAVGDLLRLRLGEEAFAWGNFAFAWLAIYQLGYCWQDGRLPARRWVALPLLAGGAGALVLLTVAGPYPVSMVTVPGAPVQNPSPPTLALLALATGQLGLVLLLRDPSRRWLSRTRPWLVVVALNTVILTLFLWHMVAAVLAALLQYATGLLATPPVGSAAWLWWRVPWVGLAAVMLAGLVLVFGPLEIRAGRARLPTPPTSSHHRIRTAVTVAGYLAALMGLWWQAIAGDGVHGPLGLPTGALALFLIGTGMLWLARRAALRR